MKTFKKYFQKILGKDKNPHINCGCDCCAGCRNNDWCTCGCGCCGSDQS